MKSLTRVLLALLLPAVPVMATVGTAAANTELVPASRLVAPLWDLTDGRFTNFFLTNVGSDYEVVHIEFYDKTCDRYNMPIELTPGDIDKVDLLAEGVHDAATLPSHKGWADIDVRTDTGGTAEDSIQKNVLLGTVVVTDAPGDWAIAYPMASTIGSAASGIGRTIVTHDFDGNALAWSGGYEPFPARLFLPQFWAEGTGLGFATQVVLAGPADGNWNGGSHPGAKYGGHGEAPGEDLGLAPSSILVSGTAQFWDGCENHRSYPFRDHWVSKSLGELFGTPKPANASSWSASQSNCGGVFPSVDEYTGDYIGWADFPNVSVDSLGAPRGMVGLFIEWTTSGGKQQGDAHRMWGDPSYGDRGYYSWVDDVDHCDIMDPSGGSRDCQISVGSSN